jgi:S-adenosylmethionine synthetase
VDFHLFRSGNLPLARQPVEYVERKGLGHPDSICDSVMEAAATALRAEYVQRCGRVLHHNLDKALLVAGQSEPKLSGGRIVAPMQIIAGDRATATFADTTLPVDEIVEAAVLGWLDEKLRFVDPKQHVAFRSEIKPGSAELTGIFDREIPVANDTSAAVGFAPLSETEQIVLQTERYMNSAEFKQQFPVAGEDVKVMAARNQQQLRLTIAVAMVDQFVPTAASYFEQKRAICDDVTQHVRTMLADIEDVSVDLNTLDDPDLGAAGMYLTVIGTSAESGDGGEVGRGNAVNGLISLCRPTSNEAAAGKNTACHVGNIYNHLSHRIAERIVDATPPVQEAYVWLCSQIGGPIDQPWSTAVSCVLEPDVDISDVTDEIQAIVDEQLKHCGADRQTPIQSTASQR